MAGPDRKKKDSFFDKKAVRKKKKGEISRNGREERERERVHEVRTGPIDLIRRIGKRLVCIPQQGSCVCKVAKFFLFF